MNLVLSKLQFKPSLNSAIINLPSELKAISAVKSDHKIKNNISAGLDFILFFAQYKTEFNSRFSEIVKFLKGSEIVWEGYPKKRGNIDTDMGRDESWSLLKEFGYRPVSQVSLNDNWSAIRLKPAAGVKNKVNPQITEYIDSVNREVKVPPELKALFNVNKKAEAFFNSLSFTNRKEYVVWIISAKREETKNNRLMETIKKLSGGKKNPSEK